MVFVFWPGPKLKLATTQISARGHRTSSPLSMFMIVVVMRDLPRGKGGTHAFLV